MRLGRPRKTGDNKAEVRLAISSNPKKAVAKAISPFEERIARVEAEQHRLDEQQTRLGGHLSLQSFKWRGGWQRGTEYAEGNLVRHRGSAWIATASSKGSAPANTSKVWDLFAEVGREGERGKEGPKGEKGPEGTRGPRGFSPQLASGIGILGGGGGGSSSQQVADALEVQLDDLGNGEMFVGESAPGSSSSAAVWRIKKVVESGSSISVQWANGSGDFNKVWDDRSSYTYQ